MQILLNQDNSVNLTDNAQIRKEVTQSLGLVKSRAELLALFKVEACPIVISTDSVTNHMVSQQRLSLYSDQYQRRRQLYLATDQIRPTYLVQVLKSQFEEYNHFQLSLELDKRGKSNVEQLRQLWSQLHIVDDLIVDLVQRMPSHDPAGWQISAQTKNHLRLPTVGRLRYGDPIADQTSINSYVLGHFGVMSHTYDRSFYVGHVLGYLFICYYFSSLSMNYGVSSLSENAIADFDYATLKTPHLVRLLQTLDGESKKRIYQLAVICAKLSVYSTDKRIEQLLIAEVNDFNKGQQKKDLHRWLADGVMPSMPEKNSNYKD